MSATGLMVFFRRSFLHLESRILQAIGFNNRAGIGSNTFVVYFLTVCVVRTVISQFFECIISYDRKCCKNSIGSVVL